MEHPIALEVHVAVDAMGREEGEFVELGRAVVGRRPNPRKSAIVLFDLLRLPEADVMALARAIVFTKLESQVLLAPAFAFAEVEIAYRRLGIGFVKKRGLGHAHAGSP